MQTSYSTLFAAGYEGQLVHGPFGRVIESCICDGPVVAGKGVTLKTSASGGTPTIVRAPETGDTADVFFGIVMYDAAHTPASTVSPGYQYADGAVVPVLRVGQIWVKTEDACTAGEDVFWRVVAEGSEEAGSFRNDADSDCVELPLARFIRTSSAGALNIVELR